MGNVVTITTTVNHNFQVGQAVTIAGTTVGGYNIAADITSVSGNTFTYIDGNLALAAATGGTATLAATVNPYTGGTILNAGTLLNTNSSNFGPGAITLNGGVFATTTGSTVFSNPINLNGFVTFNTNQPLFTGATTLTNNAFISAPNNVFFEGVVGESGGSRTLTLVTGGTLVLNNANTYTGGTVAVAGSLQFGNNNALGTGPLT